jgi:CRISPR type III-B/RAMP module RAMP protein Cmr1
MDKVTLSLSAVTPLFLGGAEPRVSAELRIPPIKSAIRYWYRAWVGRYMDEEALRVREGADLGSTKGQSPVLIRFASPAPANKMFEKEPLPFASRASRPRLPESTRFAIDFCSRSPLDWLVVPLALWLCCGGLGGRARRGGGVLDGTLRTRMIDWPDLTIADRHWQGWLGAVPRVLSPPSAWPVLASSVATVLELPTTERDARSALRRAEAVYKPYRRGCDQDEQYLGSANPRVASPVHFRPFRRDERWLVRVTVFRARWSEEPYDIPRQLAVLDGLVKEFSAAGATAVQLP